METQGASSVWVRRHLFQPLLAVSVFLHAEHNECLVGVHFCVIGQIPLKQDNFKTFCSGINHQIVTDVFLLLLSGGR